MIEYKNISEIYRKDITNALETGDHEFLDQFHEYKHEAKELKETAEDNDLLEGIVCHRCFWHISYEGHGELTLCGDCKQEDEEQDEEDEQERKQLKLF